ncbi:hypothetical protein HK413_14090 [Mucilaginibacter sp. S1162]|uniref:Uncharacterized protein n=1 Tax=Mucilaginibacter humi TaxID=2732510 RepID=A0ABX1W6X6_9SPHI|nr:hypothetical protein [Mucilaginibacter humi]NNU34895.1 hypothetical protein [Mucilaginibacter humi]
MALASGKITNAFATAQPTLFYLISPEAARMTVLGTEPTSSINEHWKKKRKGPSARRAGSMALRAEAIGLT